MSGPLFVAAQVIVGQVVAPVGPVARGVALEVLLPRTDAGVAVQVAVLLVVAAALLWLVRRNREIQWFVAGTAVLVAGLMGLRTLH